MKGLLVFLLSFLIFGCVSQTNRNQQQEEIDRTIPSCSSQRQCDAAWAAARQWVTQNCGMKIQNYSDDYIETYNSVGDATKTSCQVTKNPQPSGVNSINIRISCANMFVCVPDQYQSVIEFNKYVGTAVNNFSPIKIGAMMGMADRNGQVVENPSYSFGMVVRSLEQGYPAYNSGLMIGDIVTSVDDERIRTQSDMTKAMEKYHSGDSVELKVLRKNQEATIKIKL